MAWQSTVCLFFYDPGFLSLYGIGTLVRSEVFFTIGRILFSLLIGPGLLTSWGLLLFSLVDFVLPYSKGRIHLMVLYFGQLRNVTMPSIEYYSMRISSC